MGVSLRLLLIEAGGRDSNPLIHIPAGYMKLLDHPKITWGYISETGPDKVAIGTDYPFPWNKVPVDHIMSTPGLATTTRSRSSAAPRRSFSASTRLASTIAPPRDPRRGFFAQPPL